MAEIEEAWAEVAKTNTMWAKTSLPRDAARAYALAVLDEAWDTAQDEYSGVEHPMGLDAKAELRARIEAL